MPSTKFISEAATAWKCLNGIVCLYKPLFMTGFRRDLSDKLCEGLNAMKCRKPERIVEVRRILGSGEESSLVRSTPMGRKLVSAGKDGPDTMQILEGPNLSDHPLVVGQRYQRQDFRIWDITDLGRDTSGLCLLGLNRGIPVAERIKHMRWMRAYVVSGRFGIATDTGFHTGKLIEKSTYHKIQKKVLDRLLDSSQAAHQRGMFETTSLGLNTELAYNLASQGMMRPAYKTGPVIYSLKCTKFDLPDFDIEVHIINETEDFLKSFINDLALRLHSTATCTKLRCIKYGPFTLDNALLKKHWDLKSVINNMVRSSEILKDVDMEHRDPLIDGSSVDLKSVQKASAGITSNSQSQY